MVTARATCCAPASEITRVWARSRFGQAIERPGKRVRRSQFQSSASGWRQRRPGNRLKSRSVVIHSQPDSIANAARYASATRLPFAPALRHRRSKISQRRAPGDTMTALGWARRASANSRARSIGAGGEKTRGCVATRTNPLRTSSDSPIGSSDPTADANHARYRGWSGAPSWKA